MAMLINLFNNTLRSKAAKVEASIHQRLLTRRGSVSWNRRFGSRMHLILFEQNDEVFSNLAYSFIKEALEGETSITIKAIHIHSAGISERRAIISYSIKPDNVLRTMSLNLNATE